MKVGLVDVDSMIPNLALMKLSAYHKQQGNDVEWYSDLYRADYEKVFVSKIFDYTDWPMFDLDGFDLGGTGSGVPGDLHQDIEDMVPDYSIYNYPHNIGFLMRGCRMKCDFCVVPEKEGKARSVNSVYDIWTQRDSKFVMVLDNDFFGNPHWKDRCDEIIHEDLSVNIGQGFNIRKITEDQADYLSRIRFVNQKGKKRQVHTAFDNPAHEVAFLRGWQRCIDAGIRPYQLAVYVLIGHNTTQEEDLHRVELIRSLGGDPFVMPMDRSDEYQGAFSRWVNRRAIFKSVSWEDYRPGVIKRNQPPENQMSLI